MKIQIFSFLEAVQLLLPWNRLIPRPARGLGAMITSLCANPVTQISLGKTGLLIGGRLQTLPTPIA